MKRTAGTMMLLAPLSGCVTTGGDGTFMSGDCANGSCGGAHGVPTVPGVQGPHGQPVAMAAPYSYAPPSGKEAALAMLQNSVPLDLVQQAGYTPGKGSGILQMQGVLPGAVTPPGSITPPGVPLMPGGPGNMGIMHTAGGPTGAAVAAGVLAHGMPGRFAPSRTEVRFVGPNGMNISW